MSLRSTGWYTGQFACGLACSMVGLFGCVFATARLCRLGSIPGPDVVLCWPAPSEPFVLL